MGRCKSPKPRPRSDVLSVHARGFFGGIMMSALIFVVLFVCTSAFMPSMKLLRASSGLNGIKISVDEDEAIENVIKKFKRSVNQSGHLMELRFREQWETAAEKKKRKMQRNRQLNRIERTNDRYERLAEGQSEYNS